MRDGLVGPHLVGVHCWAAKFSMDALRDRPLIKYNQLQDDESAIQSEITPNDRNVVVSIEWRHTSKQGWF